MNGIPLVYIALTDGKQRLEISGTLDLFKKFLDSIPGAPTIYNPVPDIAGETHNPINA